MIQNNGPIYSVLTAKSGEVVCLFSNACDPVAGTPSNWVYYYPEGTNSIPSGYYSDNSGGSCSTPECFCSYNSGTVYTGAMINGHPDICGSPCTWTWDEDGDVSGGGAQTWYTVTVCSTGCPAGKNPTYPAFNGTTDGETTTTYCT